MRSASIPCNAWWCGPDGWLNVQFLVERSLEKCLRTSQPYLVYGPETSHDEEYRVPPGMSYPVFVNGIALMPDLGCRSLLSNAFIMNTIMVRPSHPAKLLQAGCAAESKVHNACMSCACRPGGQTCCWARTLLTATPSLQADSMSASHVVRSHPAPSSLGEMPLPAGWPDIHSCVRRIVTPPAPGMTSLWPQSSRR